MKKILWLVLLALQPAWLNAQNEANFYRNYYLSDVSYYSLGRHVAAKKIIEDKLLGGYFIIGRAEVSGGPNHLLHNVVCVAKINSTGQFLWTKTEGSVNYEYSDIEQMRNGRLLLADGKAIYPSGNYGSGFRMSVADNAYSSVFWEKNYVTDNNASCRAAIESINVSSQQTDGVVGCGTTSVFQGRIHCVKASDATGAIIWSNTYDFGGSNEGANDICQAEDGGYLITGYSDQHLVLFKVDSAGNWQWSHKMDLLPGQNAQGMVVLNVPDASGYSVLVGGNIDASTGAHKAFVLKRDNAGVFTLAVSALNGTYSNLHSMGMRTNNDLMISGVLKDPLNPAGRKSYLSTLSLSNIFNTTMAREFEVPESRNTVVTSDNSFITIGSTFTNIPEPLYVFKTKSNGLVNCLGAESAFPMSAHNPTLLSHSYSVTTNTYVTTLGPSPEYLTRESTLLCCYTANADVQTITIHARCNELVELVANCEGESVKWFDGNDSLIVGNNTNFLSFISGQSTHRTARKYNFSGCVVCEKRFEVIVEPEVCFTLPSTICLNQPIDPVLTCDMSRINWHRWVVTELNGAWENRVVKAQLPYNGSPTPVNIKTLWNGFIPGKCYGISLDVQDSCGNSNTLYQFFCIPAVEEDTITLSMCALNGNTTRWFEPAPHCTGAYYTFLGNDSRDYAYGYPLAPGSYVMDCMDVGGCEIKRVLVQVNALSPQPVRECYKPVYYCELMPNPEGILPDCDSCYRNDPRVELFPLEMETVNGTVRYKRKIIDWDNCRQCDFLFELVDAACQFTPNFAFYASALHPESITLSNTSVSGPGTVPCGNLWTIRDLASPVATINPAPMFSFTGTVGHTYQVCLTVTNCACGRECAKTICTNVFAGSEGPLRMASTAGSSIASVGADGSAMPAPLQQAIINIVPNPSTGKFAIANSLGLPAYDRVTINGSGGETLFDRHNQPADHQYGLTLNPGIYMVRVIAGQLIKTSKLVIH